ncbi:hypothetical protein D3C71_772980 [compost metagenome]
MRLDEHRDILRFEIRLSRAKEFRVAASGIDGGTERDLIGGALDLVEFASRETSECGSAADIGSPEPGAFLGADRHDGDIAWRTDAGADITGDDREAKKHAGRAIEIAAHRHGIEMRSDEDARTLFAALHRHVEIAAGIGRYFKAELARLAAHHVMGDLFAETIGGAGDAAIGAGAASKLVEQPFGERDIHRGGVAEHGRFRLCFFCQNGHARVSLPIMLSFTCAR